jgi:hypothetical protein
MLGLPNQILVLQEFLEGQEYVVDTVTRDGIHKVVAIWQYDKRSVNGAHFVYHGMTLIDGLLTYLNLLKFACLTNSMMCMITYSPTSSCCQTWKLYVQCSW